MKIISLIGYSGSGKTFFITKTIKKLKSELDLRIVVIKNVHTHKVDTNGKDSFEFSNAGADFSIIKNKYNQIAIFFKKELNINEILDWVSKLSNSIDIAFIEGIRGLNYPGILCVENWKDIEPQLNPYIKMISGLISKKSGEKKMFKNLPIVNIEQNFRKFLELFDIS
jgi:molybdopterin-guanine dinucleotide biosynthesis protein B